MPITRLNRGIIVLAILASLLSGCKQSNTNATAAGDKATFAPSSSDIPYNLISTERMLAHLEVLTNIQAYSGFRSAATSGEVEAFDYVADQLDGMDTLKTMGMEMERQSFEVYVATEIHTAQFFLTGADGREIELKASGLRGSRYQNGNTLFFDSDGHFDDLDSDPWEASGEITLIRTKLELFDLKTADVAGRILVADAHLFDAVTNDSYDINRRKLLEAMGKGSTGLVLVSEYNNTVGESHAAFVNEGYFFQNMPPTVRIPILSVLLEDLSPAGINGWEDLEGVTAARMLLDSDVLSPASSGNLAVRIPGENPDRAMILGAHIDSPNTPGGFDDGSGTVILLEMAEVLNESGLKPPTDLWLVWHGSHENGIYGSAWFAATHPDLLDRTLAVLNVDCLGLPMDGQDAQITLDYNSNARFGDDSAPWQEFLQAEAARLGIKVELYDEHRLIADNSNYDTYGVPEVDLIYFDPTDMEQYGGSYLHFANHWHDSYENVDVVRQVAPVLKDMAWVALAGAIETGRSTPAWRDLSADKTRAIFVASHSAPASMVTGLRELGMGLSYAGFDVDTLAYGTALTAGDLDGAAIVVLLPTYDYPGDLDESWSTDEIETLTAYVENGGLLVVTNSQIGQVMTVPLGDPNEDKLDINALLESMGVRFTENGFQANQAQAASEHALTAAAESLQTYGTGVAFNITQGELLYTSSGKPIVALVDVGEAGGQLLVIGDLGLMIDNGADADNLQFLQNIVAYVMTR
jgi:hypothetical protein